MSTLVERASKDARDQLEKPDRAGWFLVTAVALIVAYAPLLYQHGVLLWLRPHYQFFPLAILAAGWLGITRYRSLGRLSPGQTEPATIGLTLALGILCGAIALDSPWLAAVSLPILLSSLSYAAGGWTLLRAMLPALVMLGVLVPPPFELDRSLVLWLQRQTTTWSSTLLDLIGVTHLIAGNVVELPGQRLLVDEACSGVNSLFVIVACTLFVIFAERRPLVWALLLLTAAIGWVLLANVLRVFLLTLLKGRYQIDLTTGWKHDVFGFLLFGIALLLIWSTDRFLRFLFSPIDESLLAPESAIPSSAKKVLIDRKPTTFPDGIGLLTSWGLMLPALLLAVLQVDILLADGMVAPNLSPAKSLDQLSGATLPKEWGRWKQVEFETRTRNPGSYFGEVSKTWMYELGRNTAAYSVDYPFPAWHDLTRCYTSQGWVITQEEVHPPEDNRLGFVEVVMNRPGYREGYLIFSQFDRHGEPLHCRLSGAGLSLYRHGRTLERWQKRFYGTTNPNGVELPPVYQVQLFVETFFPLSSQETELCRSFYQQGLLKIRPYLNDDVKGENR